MDSDPKRTHRLDQSGALLRDVARLLSAYRQHLMEHGFTRTEAFELLLIYEKRIMGDPEIPCPHCGAIMTLTPGEQEEQET